MDFSADRSRPPLVLELTPLIDVVFLLLLFFMVSTTFVDDASGLKVDLPRSNNRQALGEASDVIVVLSADGRIAIDGEAVDREGLRAKLRSRAEADPSTLVVVRADQGLAHGRVVAVMDTVRDLGLTHFAIATESAGPRGSGSDGN